MQMYTIVSCSPIVFEADHCVSAGQTRSGGSLRARRHKNSQACREISAEASREEMP